MAVREFADSRGRNWRVWEVVPESINARTKEEDYLASMYITGWLVFETTEEDDKRRLYPVPARWTELPVAELEVLLQKAEIVPPRKLDAQKTTGEAAARDMDRASDFAERAADEPHRTRKSAREETPDITDLEVQRIFRYPGGRLWAVALRETDRSGRPVLRFTTGSRDIDLRDWPKDWPDYDDEKLVELLRDAAPRPPTGHLGAKTPRRRYNDPKA
ncbi:MAG: hypothetical protein ACREOK_02575 [Gemmatimonadaceae bacterium]